jgi:hypothetical protein
LTEPVGLRRLELRERSGRGTGDIRGSRRSACGRSPRGCRRSGRRAGARSSWAWTWTWSGSIGSVDPPRRPDSSRARRATHGISSRRQRRQQPDLVALPDRRLEPVEVADVLAVDVDVDEAVDLALVWSGAGRGATGTARRASRRPRRRSRRQVELLLPPVGPGGPGGSRPCHAIGPPGRTGLLSRAASRTRDGSGVPARGRQTASVEQTGQAGSRRELQLGERRVERVEQHSGRRACRRSRAAPSAPRFAWSIP